LEQCAILFDEQSWGAFGESGHAYGWAGVVVWRERGGLVGMEGYDKQRQR
jgi:hypothetical protein